jgi:hypothetical protein
MRLVNLTGYRIIFTDERGQIVSIVEPAEERARLEGDTEPFEVDKIRVDQVRPHRVVGLPPPDEGVLYIVNPDVARASDRGDLVTPELSNDSTHLVADTYVGVRRLLGIEHRL